MLELTNSLDETFYVARRAAIDFAIPLVTNVEQARPPPPPNESGHTRTRQALAARLCWNTGGGARGGGGV